jgi:N-acetylmuramoyl-L-alanine amidase
MRVAAVLAMMLCVMLGCQGPRPGSTVAASSTQPASAADPVFANLAEARALLAARPNWKDHAPLSLPRHPAEQYLRGMTIVLDPGHGKSDGETDPTYKRGPTGVREDDMNLRVSLLLKDLLEPAGVKVILTRDSDVLLELGDRAQIANRAEADLFLSVHHNAVDNPTANYSSVWYHGEVDDNSVELDVARYIGHSLGRHLRTDVARTSPALSDTLMYKTGFGVLRATTVPALLLEISFFTNPAEEQRLADAVYNLREAYAIYEGLCEWAYAGRPTQRSPVYSAGMLSMTLDPGLPAWWGADRNRINTSSIALFVDGKRLETTFNPTTRVLTAPAAELTEDMIVTVRFSNALGNQNFPTRYAISKRTGEPQLIPIGPVRLQRAK